MQPAKDSFTIRQGSHQTRRYQWTQGDAIISLTGASAKMQFRRSVKTEVVYEMSTTNSLITIVSDWINLIFTADSTSVIDIQDKTKLVGHLEIKLADGREFRLVEADVTIDPEITR